MQQSLWGVGPTSPLHFGYDPLIRSQLKLVEDGFSHKVLLADLHVMMTHGFPFNEARRRCAYYEAVLTSGYGLTCQFVRGSDFQLEPDYMNVLFSVTSNAQLSKVKASLTAAAKAGSKQEEFPGITVSSLLYPLMQVIDGPYLGVDVIVADPGQRKIYDLAMDGSPLAKLLCGLQRTRHGTPSSLLRIPTIQYQGLGVDISGHPLGASTASTRISIHETSDSLRDKVNRMYAPPPDQAPVEGRENALMVYLRESALPWSSLPTTLETRDGMVRIETEADLEAAYQAGHVHPQDLKHFLFEVLLERLRHFRDRLATWAYDWVDRSVATGVESKPRAR